MVEFIDVSFSYKDSPEEIQAISNLNLKIENGEHIAVIGPNSSGKSTFARLCNALELPDEGIIYVSGLTSDSMESVYKIREQCGMVFQNPDDQIIGSTLEEDVAFGPENLGLSTSEIKRRVEAALERVDLTKFRTKSTASLSGGQKQKLSIAGVLAMKPKVLILDEASSMLDPRSAEDFFSFVQELCVRENITLINITHNMEEAYQADRLILLNNGYLVENSAPQDFFLKQMTAPESLVKLPFFLQVAHLFSAYLTPDEICSLHSLDDLADLFVAKLASSLNEKAKASLWDKHFTERKSITNKSAKNSPVIRLEKVSFSYNEKSKNPELALTDVSLDIFENEILAICGQTGSGKSTLITLLNGLIKPLHGQVEVFGKNTRNRENIDSIRELVGLVFQYPERQLFAQTVWEDISFGPRQQGLEEEEIEERVRRVSEIFDIGEAFLHRSPFELSGGIQRRVAIAGVLAMNPKLLVLDEPVAGLDPRARADLLQQIESLKEQGRTIIMITHNMDDAARLADRIALMKEGRILAVDSTRNIFENRALLHSCYLELPEAMRFAQLLNEGLASSFSFLSQEEIVNTLMPLMQSY